MKAVKITILSIISNVFLASGKLVTGIVLKNSILISDGFHSFSDLGTDFITLFTLFYSKKPKDSSHPYGHTKFDNIASLFLGLLIIIGIVFFFIESLKKNLSVSHHEISLLLNIFILFWAVISIPIKELLYRFSIKANKINSSETLKANAFHHRSDVLTSIIASIAIIVSFIFKDIRNIVELAGSIIILLFVGKVGIEFVISSINALMDRAPDIDFLNKIIKIVKMHPEVKSVELPKVRTLGSEYWVDLHIRMNGDISLEKSHRISHEVKENIKKRIPKIIEVMIHSEPEGKNGS